MGIDRMTLRYAYDRPFMAKFLTDVNGRMDSHWIAGRVCCGTQTGLRPIKTGAGGYRWALRKGHCFSVRFHMRPFQAGMCVIKAWVMESMETRLVGTSVFFLTVKSPSWPSTASR
jgi:hypothetical protein